MDFYELTQILYKIRDMAYTAKDCHLSGRLYPALARWGNAPEKRKDNRSDIYCLGAALQQMLPDPEVPPEAVTPILARTLSPRPQGRYSCCEELLEDLEQALMLLQEALDSS